MSYVMALVSHLLYPPGAELTGVPDGEGGEGEVVESPSLALPPHAGVRLGHSDRGKLAQAPASLLCELLEA